jgi:molybdopterin converting factor small subunit
MIICTVEMFGNTSGTLQLELEDGAGLADLIAALRRQYPALMVGIIDDTENWLMDGYAFDVNGRFYVGDEETPLQDGDYIGLVGLVVGG